MNTARKFGKLVRAGLGPVALSFLLFTFLIVGLPRNASVVAGEAEIDRSPVDLVLTPDEKYVLTANRTAGTVSLVRREAGQVVAEVACGKRPTGLALTPDGRRAVVTAGYSGELVILAVGTEKLIRLKAIALGSEPWGVTVSPDGRWAYVALATAGEVAVVDLEGQAEPARIAVGRWPRFLALSPDGRRLAVGVSGEGGVAVIDTEGRKKLYLEDFVGLNLGQMQVGADGKYVYFPWVASRQMPTTAGNIRQGWVLGSRIGRVRLDRHSRREAVSLDPPGKAVSDPHGLALSPDGTRLVVTASGTHELLVYRTEGLPYQDYGGPGDHIQPALLRDSERFHRIPLGGRPMAVRFTRDGRQVLVANYLLNAVQTVDLAQRKVVQTVAVGGPTQPSPARRGEAIFYDGQRSLDQWYSCHTCHYEGHTNSVTMDNRSDGRNGFAKTVLTLRNVTRTGPWRWNGWQTSLDEALRKSLTDTMQGKEPTADDLQALTAFLETLKPPPSRSAETADESARRGEKVFRGDRAGCSRCHPAPNFTDGRVHGVGLVAPGDIYKGYKTPSLLGVSDRILYLHDGRARSLEEVLRGPHAPERVTRQGVLTEPERRDLIAYLRSL